MDRTDQGARPTRLLAVAAAVAIVAVASAAWAWTADSTRPTTLPVVESHQLSADQAACLEAGLVMRRSNVLDLELRLGKYQTLEPDAGVDLQTETDGFDDIAPQHPGADQSLTRAFAEVADEGTATIGAHDVFAYRDGVSGWAAARSTVAQRCLEIAEFDVEALDIGQSGR